MTSQTTQGHPEEQIADYTAAFQVFDKDGDGCITKDELRTVMGGLHRDTDEKDIEDFMSTCDKDGNGTIELSEFLDYMKQLDKVGDYREAFSVFDKDKNGFISATELKQVMASLGETLTDEQIEDMVREADTDGDGQVNYTEFAKLMARK